VEIEHYENGVPSWVDLGAADVATARAFYGGLFGWNTPEGPAEAGGYSVCDIDGKTVAGLGPNMAPGAPPHWSTYVNVESADDTIAKVEANGGQVYMPPMDVMAAGRMAVFADPEGAAIGLWQPGEHLGAQLVNEPGTYCWSELMTDDPAAAKSFYNAVLGWDAETQGPEGPGGYTEWKVGGRSIGGMMAKPPSMPAGTPSFWGVYFAVADTDASILTAQGLGASVLMPAADIEPGRFAVLADPDGAMFSILALKPELQG
jgi:predicted enzyme related to lactoylglutathione lyase